MYKIHYRPDTASLVIRIVLGELGLAAQLQLVPKDSGVSDSAQYRALHPLGFVPAIETPNGPMFETAAILLYLADTHGALAPPPHAAERAAFLKWLFFTSTNVHTTFMQLFYPERVAGPEHVDAVLFHARQNMQIYLQALDDMVRVEAPVWLSPAHPSILGHYLGMLIRWMSSYGPQHASYFSAASFPALHQVLQMHEARAAALAIAADEGLGGSVYTNPQY